MRREGKWTVWTTWEEVIRSFALSCRDKGMGPPITQVGIADYLWNMHLEHPNHFSNCYPDIDEVFPNKELFYEWVLDEVREYDRHYWPDAN